MNTTARHQAEGDTPLGEMSFAVPKGLCVARVHLPAQHCPAGTGGPTIAVMREDGVYIGPFCTETMAELLDRADLPAVLAHGPLTRIGSVEEVTANSRYDRRDPLVPHLLPPVDLQVVKACGVTFAASMLERVLEERAKGDPVEAARLRESLVAAIGTDLRRVRPGSEQARELKCLLIDQGLWSQYLEVGIGPHAEVFTKAPVLSSVGTGARVGVRGDSVWNNPEPEVVLVVDSSNRVRGAALGNDVNLRDFEGRSALLLGEAKDNNASCSIGPWIRLFDDAFGLGDLMQSNVEIEIHGPEGWTVRSQSELSTMSRDAIELVEQVGGRTHQYPDGYALFLGTGFAPTADRDEPGSGFTHMVGDRVVIRNDHLGVLTNWVGRCEDVPPWTDGIRSLWRNLSSRSRQR